MTRMYFFCLGWMFVWQFVSSCTEGGKRVSLPVSQGEAYEICVIGSPDIWQHPSGEAILQALDIDVPGLPQAERSFHIVCASSDGHKRMPERSRNLVVLTVDTFYARPKLVIAQDVYASPQAVLTIQASDEDVLIRFVSKNRQVIADYFTQMERERQLSMLAEHHSADAASAVRDLFGCEVLIPAGLNASKKGEDFFWVSTNVAAGDRNFLIYAYPYTSGEIFTKACFVHKRDSVMRINIPGAVEGTYMETDSLMTEVRPVSVQGRLALEARGLWRVKGDFMGGPFVSHVHLDTVNRRVVVAEVFVYAPGRQKRNLIRPLEASLYSLKLPAQHLKKSGAY